jgi:hypothetical protein
VVAWSRAELPRGVALTPLFCLFACSSEPLTSTDGQANAGGLGGQLLSVRVPSAGEALVDLATPAVLPTSAEPRPALGWDLGFHGFEVFTNGGISSAGAGAGLHGAIRAAQSPRFSPRPRFSAVVVGCNASYDS